MHPRTVVALLSGFVTTAASTGCIVPPHDRFDTPQDTVLTFQSAFARDDEFKEYDCFSRRMRNEQGVSQQRWSIARAQVFEPFGAIGRFVLRRNSLEDNLVGGAIGHDDASLVYELFGNRLQVEVVPEPVLRLPDPISGKVDDWPVFEAGGSAENHGASRIAIDVGRELATRLEADGVAWAELRRHWKVNAIAASDAAEPPPPLSPGPAERSITIRVGAISFARARESLGVVRLHVLLPRPPSAHDCVRWESETAPLR